MLSHWLRGDLTPWRNVGPELAAWSKAGLLVLAKGMHGDPKRIQPGGTPEQVALAQAIAEHAGHGDAPRWVVLAYAAHLARLKPLDVVEFCRLTGRLTRPPTQTRRESHHGPQTGPPDQRPINERTNHTASETTP